MRTAQKRDRAERAMKDVAEHARVSVSTVSYVLNDSGPAAVLPAHS
jgi:LacI family transcriptional regulator